MMAAKDVVTRMAPGAALFKVRYELLCDQYGADDVRVKQTANLLFGGNFQRCHDAVASIVEQHVNVMCAQGLLACVAHGGDNMPTLRSKQRGSCPADAG